MRTSDLLSGRINSSLLAESTEEEGGNVVEYVAGTLDSWFGLGKEENEKEDEEADDDNVSKKEKEDAA